MRDFLTSTLNKFNNQADYIEIRLDKNEYFFLSFQGKNLDQITRSSNLGGCVRAMTKGGWGFVSFNSIDNLNEKVLHSIRQSKIVGKSNLKFPEKEIKEAIVKVDIKSDPRKIPSSEKKKLFEHYNSLLLSKSNKIQSTQVTFRDEIKTTYFANSFGTYIEQERLDVVGRFLVIARDGNTVKQAFESVTSRNSYDAVLNLDKNVLDTADRALRQLSAKPV